MKYTHEHPRPALSVDIVLFKAGEGALEVLLIRRVQPPFEDQWALPGGFVEIDEDLDSAAHSELAEETGLMDLQIEQLRAYGDPHRDPRGRVVTIAYYGLIPPCVRTSLNAGDDASQARWFPLHDLPWLAFDHQQIIADALARLDPSSRRNSPSA